MAEIIDKMGMGWLPDLPDFRDYSPEHEKIKPMLEEIRLAEPEKVSLPPSVDLRSK